MSVITNENFTPISDLLSYCTVEMAGVPEPLLLRTIRDVAIDFFRQTQIWIYELPAINIKADTQAYDLDLDFSCAIIERVTLVARYFTPDDGNRPDFPAAQQPIVDYLISNDKSQIILTEKPTAALRKALFVTVALRPARDVTELPQRIFEDWYIALSHGVMSRLYLMPNKSWSDKEQGNYYRSLYRDGIRMARIEQQRGRMNSNINMKQRLRGFIVDENGYYSGAGDARSRRTFFGR